MSNIKENNNLRFSQRKGYTPVREMVQKKRFDKETQNKLWDVIAGYLGREIKDSKIPNRDKVVSFIYAIYSDILYKPMDEIPTVYQDTSGITIRRMPEPYDYDSDDSILYKVADDIYHEIRNLFFNNPFHTQLDIIEKFVQSFNQPDLVDRFNATFKKLLVGYGITEFGKVIDIDNEEEYNAIDQAARETYHIEKATQLLYERKKQPDYANSIKESISAVEEVCRDITGMKKATLSDCLKHIDKHMKLHKAFKDALDKLYGWTSDKPGVRHGGKADIGFEYAKFMLVTCSAFVNYLKEKQIQINTKKK